MNYLSQQVKMLTYGLCDNVYSNHLPSVLFFDPLCDLGGE